jgi:hypothetical protein
VAKVEVLCGRVETRLDPQALAVALGRREPGPEFVVGDDLVGAALDFFKSWGHG